MREIIINALRLKYKGIMAEAQANIEIYLENPAGIGEHQVRYLRPSIVNCINLQKLEISY